MLAEPVHRLVVHGVLVVIIEEPPRALARQTAVHGIFVRCEAAHMTGVLGLAVGGFVQPSVVSQRRGECVAAMIVPSGEFGAWVAGEPHDDARQFHGETPLKRERVPTKGPSPNEIETAKAGLSSITYAWCRRI